MTYNGLNASTLDDRLEEERKRVEESMVTVPGYSGPRPFSMAYRKLDDDQRRWVDSMMSIDDGEWSGQDYLDYMARPKGEDLQLEPGASDATAFKMKGVDGELSFAQALDHLDADDRKRLLDMQLAYGGRLDTQKALDYLASEKPWNEKIKRTQDKFNARLEAAESEMERVKMENARNDLLANQGDWRHIEGGDPLSNVFARGHAILRGDTKDPGYAEAAGQVMEELNDRMQDFAQSAFYKSLPQADKRKYRESQSVLANALSDARQYASRPKDMGLVEEAERSMWRFLVGNVQGLAGVVDFAYDLTGFRHTNRLGEGAAALMRDEYAPSQKEDNFWSLNHFVSTFSSGAMSMASMMALGPVGLPMMAMASGGEQYSEAKEDLLRKNPNMSRAELVARAGGEAILAGTTTWAVEHLSEMFGMGLIPGMPAKTNVLGAATRKGWRGALWGAFKAWGAELGEEMVENNLQDFYKQIFRGEGEQFKDGAKGWRNWEWRLLVDSAIGTASAMVGGAFDRKSSGIHDVLADADALGDYGIKDGAMQAYVRHGIAKAISGDRRSATALQSAMDEIATGEAREGNPIVAAYARQNGLTFGQAADKLKGEAKASGNVLGQILDNTRAMGASEMLRYASENPLGLTDAGDIRMEQLGDDAWLVSLAKGNQMLGAAFVGDKSSALALQDLLRTSWSQADEGVLKDLGEEGGDVRYIGKVDGKWTLFDDNGGKVRELSEDETARMEAQYATQKGELPRSGELTEGNGHVGMYVGDQYMYNGRPFSVSYAGSGRDGRSRWQIRGTTEDLKWAADKCKSLRVVSNDGGRMTVEGANPRDALLMASRRDALISLDGHSIAVQFIGKDEDGKAKWAVLAPSDDMKWLSEHGFDVAYEDETPVIHGDNAIASIRQAIDPDGKMEETDGFFNEAAMQDYLSLANVLPGPDSSKGGVLEYLRGLDPAARSSALAYFAEEGKPVAYFVQTTGPDGRMRRVFKVATRHQCVMDIVEAGGKPAQIDGRYYLLQTNGEDSLPIGQEAYKFAMWMNGEKVEGEREKPEVGSAASVAEQQQADIIDKEYQAEVAETVGQAEQPQAEQPQEGQAEKEQQQKTEGQEEETERKPAEKKPAEKAIEDDRVTKEDVIDGNLAVVNDEIAALEGKGGLQPEEQDRLDALRVERKTLEGMKENSVEEDDDDNGGDDGAGEGDADAELERLEKEETETEEAAQAEEKTEGPRPKKGRSEAEKRRARNEQKAIEQEKYERGERALVKICKGEELGIKDIGEPFELEAAEKRLEQDDPDSIYYIKPMDFEEGIVEVTKARRPHLDENGNYVYGNNGKPVYPPIKQSQLKDFMPEQEGSQVAEKETAETSQAEAKPEETKQEAKEEKWESELPGAKEDKTDIVEYLKQFDGEELQKKINFWKKSTKSGEPYYAWVIRMLKENWIVDGRKLTKEGKTRTLMPEAANYAAWAVGKNSKTEEASVANNEDGANEKLIKDIDTPSVKYVVKPPKGVEWRNVGKFGDDVTYVGFDGDDAYIKVRNGNHQDNIKISDFRNKTYTQIKKELSDWAGEDVGMFDNGLDALMDAGMKSGYVAPVTRPMPSTNGAVANEKPADESGEGAEPLAANVGGIPIINADEKHRREREQRQKEARQIIEGLDKGKKAILTERLRPSRETGEITKNADGTYHVHLNATKYSKEYDHDLPVDEQFDEALDGVLGGHALKELVDVDNPAPKETPSAEKPKEQQTPAENHEKEETPAKGQNEDQPPLEIKTPLGDATADEIVSAIKNDGRTLLIKLENEEWPKITIAYEAKGNYFARRLYRKNGEDVRGRQEIVERIFTSNLINVVLRNDHIVAGYIDESTEAEAQPQATTEKQEQQTPPAKPEKTEQPPKKASAAKPSESGNQHQPEAAQDKEDAAEKPAPSKPATAKPKPQGENFMIPADEPLVPGSSQDVRIRANIEAIRLLKKLEAENRPATNEEKLVLMKFTSWGGLQPAFRYGEKYYAELKELLTPEEYSAAHATILDAFYTDKPVIAQMWRAATLFGFKGGRVGEFGAGVGHFLGMVPPELAASTQFTAVELDNITAGILRKLYPQAKVVNKGLESTRIGDGTLDMVIGNFPFGSTRLQSHYGTKYAPMMVHDYFFVRALDAVRPGGFVIALTSHGTMDKTDPMARMLMGDKANLVGIVRLPETAFRKNAGTSVVTDIVVLQKKQQGDSRPDRSFQEVSEITIDGETVRRNAYFDSHPNMILGKESLAGSMYRAHDYTVEATEGDLEGKIQGAFDELQKEKPVRMTDDAAADEVDYDDEHRDGFLYLDADGGLTYNIKGVPTKFMIQTTVKGKKAYRSPTADEIAVFKSLVKLNSAYTDVLTAMQEGATDEELNAKREIMKRVYDGHVSRYGTLNSRKHSVFRGDPRYARVQALEKYEKKQVKDAKGRLVEKVTVLPGDVFSKRTIMAETAPSHVNELQDAVALSYRHKGEIDVDFMAGLLGREADEVENMLLASGDYYRNPETEEVESADDYLSGNVVEKLRIASEASTKDPGYQRNVEALTAVRPKRKRIQDLGLVLGQSWIPGKTISDFLMSKYGVSVSVAYHPSLNSMATKGEWKTSHVGGVLPVSYDIGNKNLMWILDRALNKGEVRIDDAVIDDYGKTKMVPNKELSKQAMDLVKKLNAEFEKYAKTDQAASQILEDVYNDTVNVFVPRKFREGESEFYPGANHDIHLRGYQRRAVERMLRGNTLLDHCVGAGKTFTMITAAMTLKYQGKASKSMIVVQNSTINSFANDARKLYPGAKILAATEEDLAARNRARFLASVAAGDWDIVIIPQSSFDLLPNNPRETKAFYESAIEQLEAMQEEKAAEQRGGRKKDSDIQRAIKSLQERLAKLLAADKKDYTMTFDELGIDALFIDEAHEYRKNFFITGRNRIKGLDKNSSAKAANLYLKIENIRRKKGNHNVFFATGTPIVNTLTELWNMERYLRPDVLAAYHVETFDEFADMFCVVDNEMEYDAGGRVKFYDRFSKYQNCELLGQMWREAADVLLSSDPAMQEIPRPKITGGKPDLKLLDKSPVMEAFMKFAADTLNWFEHLPGKEKMRPENMAVPMMIYGMARRATVDMRLIDSHLPDVGGKVTTAVPEIMKTYKETESEKGAQVVFVDSISKDKFDVQEELKRKLVEAGIPAEQIAVVNAQKTKKDARQAIFDKVNSGDVRVVIGHSQVLGVGVNIQERLKRAHFLDPTQTPALMEQRLGRIVRFGNIYPEVDVTYYAITNTLDATMYQTLARKAHFIEQVRMGGVDSFIEDSDSADYKTVAAMANGNPDILELAKTQRNIQELTMRRSAYYQQRGGLLWDEESDKRDIERYERYIAEDSAFASRHANETFEKVTLIDKDGKRHEFDKSEAKEYLKAMWQGLGDKVKGEKDGAVEIADIVMNGVKVRFSAIARTNYSTGDKEVVYSNAINGDAEAEKTNYGGHWEVMEKSPTTALDSIRNRLTGFDAFVEHQKNQLELKKEHLRQTQEELAKPFDGDKELETLQAKETELLGRVGASKDDNIITKRPKLADYLKGVVPGIDENIDVDFNGQLEDTAPDLDEDEDSGVSYRESDDGNPDKYYEFGDGSDDDSELQPVLEAMQKRFPGVPINYLYENELPDAIQNLLDHDRNQGKFTYWKGFYYNGKIYINPLTATSRDDVVTTIMHEAGVHFGLKQLFSDKAEYARFLDAMQDIPLVNSRMGKYTSKGYSRADAVEEVVGEIADKYYGSPMWKRMLTTISDFFRKMLAKIGIDVELDETQIREIVKASAKAAESAVASDGDMQSSSDTSIAYKALGINETEVKERLSGIADETKQWFLRMFSPGNYRGGVIPTVNKMLKKAQWELCAQSDEFKHVSDAELEAVKSISNEPWKYEVMEAMVKCWNGLIAADDLATEVPHFDDPRVRKIMEIELRKREIVDWLSSDAANIAKLSPAMRAAIMNHLGTYHLRAYEIHHNPNYKPTSAVKDLAVGRIISELEFQIEATEAVISASSEAMANVFKERYAKVQAMLDRSFEAMSKMLDQRSEKLAAKLAEFDKEIDGLIKQRDANDDAVEKRRLDNKIQRRRRAKDNLARRFNEQTNKYVAQREAVQNRLRARRDSYRWQSIQPDLYLYLKTRDEAVLVGKARPFVNRAHAFAHMMDRITNRVNGGVEMLLDDKEQIKLEGNARDVRGTAMGIVERILQENRGDDQFAVNMDIGPSFRVIQSSFIRRKDIAPEIRKLLGEIEDVGRQFAMTVGKLSRIVVMDKMYRELWESQKGLDNDDANKVFFTSAYVKKNGKRYSTELKGAKYGMLEGMFTDYETKRMLDGYSEPRGKAGRIYTKVIGWMRYAKTVANPPTHLRNFLGNMTFAACDGEMFRVKDYYKNMARAYKVLTGTDEESRQERQRLMRYGLIGSGAHSQEIADIADSLGLTDADFDIMTASGKIMSLAHKLQEFAEFAYALEDNLFRLAALYTKEQRGIDTETAVRRIRDLYPTYDMAPVLVSEFARYNPFIKDFIIFKAEAVRCFYNSFKYAAQDMKDGDWLSSIGLTATVAAATEIGQLLMGGIAKAMRFWEDRDKDREMLSLPDILALRKLLPDYRTDNLILPWRVDKDVIKYIDGGYIYPYDYLPMLSAEMTSGGKPGRTAAELGRRLIVDPVFGGMGLDLFSAMYAGRNPTTGRRLKAEPGGYMGYLAKSFAPSAWTYAARGLKLLMSEEGRYTTSSGEEITWGNELAKTVLPFRATTLNIPTAYRIKMRRLCNEVSENQAKANAAWRKYYTGQGLKMDAEAAEKAAQAAYDGELGDLLADLEGAGARFLTQDQRDQLLKDAGFSAAKREAILAGHRLKYARPEDDGKK